MWNLVAMETAEHSKCLPLIDCYIVAVFSHLEGVNERIGVSERHMCLVCVCVCRSLSGHVVPPLYCNDCSNDYVCSFKHSISMITQK